VATTLQAAHANVRRSVATTLQAASPRQRSFFPPAQHLCRAAQQLFRHERHRVCHQRLRAGHALHRHRRAGGGDDGAGRN
jgi:hypothetical protein